MFCKNCGSNLKDGSTFCHNCGSPVNDYVVNNPQVASVPQSAPLQAPTHVQNPAPMPCMPPIQPGYVVYPAPMQEQSVPTPPTVFAAPANPPIYQNVPNVQPPMPQQYGYMPYPMVQETKKNSPFSVMSLIFGIIGIALEFLGILFAPAALIFGIIGRKKGKSGMAVAGIILGAIGTVLSIISILTIIFVGESLLDSFLNDGGLYF